MTILKKNRIKNLPEKPKLSSQAVIIFETQVISLKSKITFYMVVKIIPKKKMKDSEPPVISEVHLPFLSSEFQDETYLHPSTHL